MPLPKEDCRRLGLPPNSKIGDGIARALSLSAVRGTVDAAREIADRTEGKVIQRSGFGNTPPPAPTINVEFVSSPYDTPPPITGQIIETDLSATPELQAIEPATADNDAPADSEPRCTYCGELVELYKYGRIKRLIHVHSKDPYCNPDASGDGRTATLLQPERI
jgi:hypothetical protein